MKNLILSSNDYFPYGLELCFNGVRQGENPIRRKEEEAV
jgi:hypothetical protein